MGTSFSMARLVAQNSATRNNHGRIQGRKGQALRQRRLKRTHGLCEDCLNKNLIIPANVVDHITPLALGGKDIDSNTRNLCDPCHEKRTAEQFGHKLKVETGTDGWPL